MTRRMAQLTRYQAELSPGKPWARCGRWPAGGGGVLVERIDGHSRYGNLKHCGSRNVCADCHLYARTRSAREIKLAATKWDTEAHGLAHVTLTFPHWAGLMLVLLWPFVSKGLAYCMSGRPWRAAKADLRIRFDIRALEATVGLNGWHPHVHLLLFLDRPVDAEVITRLHALFYDRWGSWVRRHGFGQIHPVHGVKVTEARSAAADYVAKVQAGKWDIGSELAKSGTKRGRRNGRTFFQVVADHREAADPADLALIREWEATAPGKQMLRMSNGLRRWAGLDGLSDAELAELTADPAEDPPTREAVAVIPPEAWAVVGRFDHLWEATLDASDAGGLPAINDLLARLGLPMATRPPPGWRPPRDPGPRPARAPRPKSWRL
jgi:hypothetical protein